MANKLKIVIDDVDKCPVETIEKFIGVLQKILRENGHLATGKGGDETVTDAWDYLLGEISASGLCDNLHDGTLTTINNFLRRTNQQKTAEPCGDAKVALNALEEIEKLVIKKIGGTAWPSVFATIRATIISKPQPAAHKQIDAGELEAAIELVDEHCFESHAANVALNKVIEAARAHLSKLSGDTTDVKPKDPDESR